MKIRILIAAASIAAAHSSSAALIAAWDLNNAPSSASDSTPPPWDYADHVTVSDLVLHGTVTGTSSGSPMIYTGFSSTITETNYVGFTVSANAGYTMTLTDLAYVQPSATGDLVGKSFSWGYRINGGTWNMFTGEIAYASTAIKSFVFSTPITTTGSVEFGFFGSAISTTGTVPLSIAAGNRNDIQLNGSLAAVPEPSSLLMGGLTTLSLLMRRRRK